MLVARRKAPGTRQRRKRALSIFSLCILIFAFSLQPSVPDFIACAADLETVNVYFLKGDYKAAISEGEKLLAQDAHSAGSDQLYYILGLSYLKDGNYLRASDIFEIIIKEFKNSKYADEARLGLGDTYFLMGDYDKAGEIFKAVLNNNASKRLMPQVYYRLSQVGYKKGDTLQGKEYFDKLKQEFSLSPELKYNIEEDLLTSPESENHYTVQIGSFANSKNARNLTQKLIQNGYPAYCQEADLEGRQSYKVRVGKLERRQEAQELEKKLMREGYPTKIYP